MKREEIKARLELLHAVLKYCSDDAKTFERGERVMINQERASLMKKLEAVGLDDPKKELLDFKVSPLIEQKITNIKSKEILSIPMPYLFD